MGSHRARVGVTAASIVATPLDVAAHLAHNLYHLRAEGGTVYSTLAALFGGTAGAGDPIQVLQFALLALGLAGSLCMTTQPAVPEMPPRPRIDVCCHALAERQYGAPRDSVSDDGAGRPMPSSVS